MRRRAFVATAGAAVVWPLIARARLAKQPTIGVLVAGTPDPGPFLKALREGLRAFGYAEGRDVALEIRSAEGDPKRLSAVAAAFVRSKVDIIVAYQTPAVQAAKLATHDIPIVMSSGDPVGTGLVASLAHPGGNITGMSGATAETAAKNVQLIRDVLPGVRRVGVLSNAADPFSKPFLGQIEGAAKALGVAIRPAFARDVADLDAAFAEMVRKPLDAVIVQPSLGTTRPAALALKHRLPATSPNRPFAHAGGLMSYSNDSGQLWRRLAAFIDKILKGAKPADLPVQQPTTFDLAINLRTAKALGIAIPQPILLRADEVIE